MKLKAFQIHGARMNSAMDVLWKGTERINPGSSDTPPGWAGNGSAGGQALQLNLLLEYSI
jgi:hypothetical protein